MLKRLQDNNSIISNFVKVHLPINIQKAEPNIDRFCVILKIALSCVFEVVFYTNF
ncbi:hypothetical protein ACUXJN_001387 [Staphylococcus capitis]|uniref:hypothetical protein n=1 Tax=Staphylococcus capitis TaxID=29388 RepID=UPI0001EF4983|nr:hypothetical protein [Staphylococcus capitis]EFS17504.1 hypothetical protein HMPREF0786_00503 [Staphylococcus capitis C87]MBF0711602.1 hypothetical protein [Staphylococcus capitis]MBF2239002.1 hypothetical protein [Staphylococcus capitis]MBF8048969.1 hypothetical protein [Staphylococcus capitis]MCC3706049.1 hypothetical protein [Staphylococcus capitis]